MADKIPPSTPGNPAIEVPGKPLLKSFPTPNHQDRILQVKRDSRKGAYEPPDKGSKFQGPDEELYSDYLFSTAIPHPATPVGWWLEFYLNERKNQDEYNYTIEYPWVDNQYPRVTRTYVFLRGTVDEPDPDEVDPANEDLSLVDFKLTRADDPIIDSLFVALTKVYERVPAPTEYTQDRADAVLPYNMRVRVPAFEVTTVDEEAAQVPILVNEEDWRADETTNTFNRRTRKLTKRVIPNGSVTLDKGKELTRDQQLAHRTQTWQIGDQDITPRATTIRSTVEDIGNNTSVKDELTVDRVFPATEIKVEIPDIIPAPFRALVPTRTIGVTSEGQVVEPVLQIGEIERIHRAETDLIKREIVTGRDITQLPKTLKDYDIDGIPSHGSVFGGIFENARTLAATPQEVDEGFYVKNSSVLNLGNGLTLKETKQLTGVQGAHLLLTDGGTGFTCDPAVVFSTGTVGSDAAGTAVISPVPAGGVLPGEDIGGTFPLDFTSPGDNDGVFYFLGARYNNGVWTNPATNNTVDVSVHCTPSQVFSDAVLARFVDRTTINQNVSFQPTTRDGSENFEFDLGIGRALVPNLVTIKTFYGDAHTHKARLEASNDRVSWTMIADNINLPATPAHTWVAAAISSSTPYRYFRVFGIDPTDPALIPPTFPRFGFDEIEFYGTLTIAPAIQLNYLFDGDNQGVAFYLGKRGNQGTWRNPHTNGDLTISVDSPGTLTGTLDEIVDRQPSNVYSDGVAGRSFYFDLGAERNLVCNKVSFRQRTAFASGNPSFVLAGSNDFSSWANLVTVNNSQQPDLWTTATVVSTTKYRYFRITSSTAFFTIGELELYGALQLDQPGGSAGTTYAVTSVTMTDVGHDYVAGTVPEVRFVGGGGTGAAGTAVLEGDTVVRVDMTNAGVGYTSVPLVVFLIPGGGKDAAATGNISGGGVVSYTITDPGVEYYAVPLVEVIGDGTGATATVTINAAGQVTAITPGAIGSGYTTASVLFRNAGGPTAIAKVGYGVASITRTNSGGKVYSNPPAVEVRGDGAGCQARAVLGFPLASVEILNRGQNYTSTPTVTASTVGQGGGVTGATFTATRGFSVASVSFSPSGTLYLNEPAVVVSGGGAFGQGAQFKAWVGRKVLSLQLGLQGSDYSPDVAISMVDPGGTGTGATGAVVRSFALAGITGGTGGTGYTTASVVIGAPTGLNGVQATAHAVLLLGVVDSIVIDNEGFGYLTAPTIGVTGDGTGATGWTATLETNGAIDSVSLGASGVGYSEAPTVNITASSGTGATISSVLNTASSDTLVKVTIINGGSGYTTAPTLAISGAPAPVATLATSGQIVAITITSGGEDYIQNAALIFTGGGGSGASAKANTGGLGRVKLFVIDDPGSGFTFADVIVSAGTAAGTAVLSTSGTIKTLTLIDPGPDYAVAPLVSFFGCSGTGAAALYILASGFPELTDYVTDPVEGIVVEILKKIVRPDAVRPSGYVDQFALDKYRSIQIISSVDLSTLPDAETFSMTHVLNMPDTLVSIGSTYTRDISRAVGIDTAFGSTSVHSSVKGKLFARVSHGYKGPAKATVIRKFLPAPPVAAQTPDPLIITPSTGTVYLISRSSQKATSLGVRGGFGYIDNSEATHEDIDALDMSGVLTGGLITTQTSGVQTVDAIALAASSLARAQQAGFFFTGFRTNVAQNVVTAEANLIADIGASCPQRIPPGTTFLLSAVVEKWRLGIYVQTLTYVTVPCPGPSHTYLGQFICDPCGGAITGPGPSGS